MIYFTHTQYVKRVRQNYLLRLAHTHTHFIVDWVTNNVFCKINDTETLNIGSSLINTHVRNEKFQDEHSIYLLTGVS